MESVLRLDQPLRLDRLGVMLDVIRVEFADYKLTKASYTYFHCQMSHVVLTWNVLQENCWAMTSVIMELLERVGKGSYLRGKLCFPEWAPEVRGRVQSKFMSASRALTPVQLRFT